MSERKERCDTCRFWEIDGLVGDEPDVCIGWCKRMPPTFPPREVREHWIGDSMGSDGFTIGLWPHTQDINYCGEWKPREAWAVQPVIIAGEPK
jgi:hypothetical protein